MPGEDPTLYPRRLSALVERHQPQDDATLLNSNWRQKPHVGRPWQAHVEEARGLKAIHDARLDNGEQAALDGEQFERELASPGQRALRLAQNFRRLASGAWGK